jgi:hypothetical protein
MWLLDDLVVFFFRRHRGFLLLLVLTARCRGYQYSSASVGGLGCGLWSEIAPWCRTQFYFH